MGIRRRVDMDRNVFQNVFLFKTGIGNTGIVRADSLAEAAARVVDMTNECVTMVIRAANIENSDYGVVMFKDIFNEIN